jgi:hypothetical protein
MVNQTILQKKIYGGTVESRLAFGLLLFRKFNKLLAELTGVYIALARMRTQESALAAHMQALMLGRVCSSCASSDGGGCCSKYMAGETDSLQILINLMVGVDVAQVNYSSAECCYLGAATGCIFIFKPMFCLNYNCSSIKVQANGSGLRQLERLAAVLLGSQYELEMLLFRLLSTHESLQKNIFALPTE